MSFNASYVTNNRVRSLEPTEITIGSNVSILANSSKEILVDFEIGENVSAWQMNLVEIARPTAELTDGNIKVKIEYTDEAGNYIDLIEPTSKVTFSEVVPLSLVDKEDSVFVTNIDSVTKRRSNVMLFGKHYNIPKGRFLKVTLINDRTEGATIIIKNVQFIVEGWL